MGLKDKMEVTVLGTAGGTPLPGRAQSGILIEVSGSKMLLDCGMGIPLRLAEADVEPEELDTICLTHGHLDHIQDLPSITKGSWLRTGEADYEVILPSGLEDKLVGFWKSVDEYERTDLHFRELPPSDTYSKGDLTIESFKTEHTSLSQGYKISASDKSVVYTGDTAPCEGVKGNADDLNLLIHELSSLDRSEKHTHPESLINYLQGLSVKKLVLTHFYPEIAERSDDLGEKIERETDISTTAAEDLQSFSI